MKILGIQEKDYNGGPLTSWRRMTMGTSSILEKTVMGTPVILKSMRGTLGILEQEGDGDFSHLREQPHR